MKIERYPLVSLYEISGMIAQRYALNGIDEQMLTHQVYWSLMKEMTDTDTFIIRYYIPDNEESYWDDFTVEFRIMFDIVMENCGLSWGDCFLVDLTS